MEVPEHGDEEKEPEEEKNLEREPEKEHWGKMRK